MVEILKNLPSQRGEIVTLTDTDNNKVTVSVNFILKRRLKKMKNFTLIQPDFPGKSLKVKETPEEIQELCWMTTQTTAQETYDDQSQ